MPKMKSRRAATKRFRITKKGTILRHHAKTRHLLECKSSGKMRRLGKAVVVDHSDAARVRSMLAGG